MAALREPPVHRSRLTSDRLSDDLALIEIDLLSTDDLIGFVALAGQEDGVTTLAFAQRPLDGGETIGDAAVWHAPHSLFDVINDGVGIFHPGIVGRHHGQIRMPSGDPPHDGTLAA